MRRLCFSILYLLAFSAVPAPAATIIRSTYQADFLGLPLSRSYLIMTLGDKSYRIEGAGRTSAIAAVIAPMKATLDAQGMLDRGAIKPESFSAHIVAGKSKYDIELDFKNGALTKEAATPPKPAPDLVPVTEAMKKNVIDPLSAFLVPASMEKACARMLPIYTGRERFDLALAFNRKEKVSVPGLYEGEAVVCSARYVPHGGHRAAKKEIKYMVENREMEAWFIPLPGTGLMGLYRARIGTKLGPLTVTLEKAGLQQKP